MYSKFILKIWFFALGLLLPVLVLSGCSAKGSHRRTEIKEALNELDKTIKDADKYVYIKQQRIDSLKKRIEDETNTICQNIDLYSQLASQYRQLDSDSAIYYGFLANQSVEGIDDSGIHLQANLQLANALSTSGIFNEALKILDNIDVSNLKEYQKIDYWKACRMLYAYAMSYINEDNHFTDTYRFKYREIDDSLINYLPKGDSFRNFVVAERLVGEGKSDEAKRELLLLTEREPMESNLYGMAAYQLAKAALQTGDRRRYMEALAQSARSDIMGGVREGLALPTLANSLYEEGDIDNAFKYMSFALKEANSANIRMRTVAIANYMSMIDEAYKRKLDTSNRAMRVFLIIACCLLGGGCILALFLYRNMKKTKQKELTLEQTSRKLQDYVGNFISLCSNYSSRLEQLGKLVTRKIKADQTGELVKLIGSGRFAEEDNEEFYRLIDKAFRDIFPDFIPRLNKLLQADMQIPEDSSASLTPELRIYACVRLGVDQSAKIAQILHYSVNTVYSYRNRMRNRAIDRDTFDRDVMNMGF